MKTADQQRAASLVLDCLRSDLGRRGLADGPLGEECAILLGDWPTPVAVAERVAPAARPACRFLEPAVAAATGGPMRDLAAAIAPLCPALSWTYGYPVQPDAPDLDAKLCFSQIIGPRGLLTDAKIHVGLTLMAPRTLYPLHAHPAIETYLVLSGTAAWRVEREPFGLQPPGSLVFHRSGIGHAMRTDDEPMLALYLWRGDLETAPVYIDEPAQG